MQAEGGLDLAEGADRSDHGQAGDSPMDIAGLSLPHTASVDGLHNQSHPFNSAGQPASSAHHCGALSCVPNTSAGQGEASLRVVSLCA